MTRRMAAVWLAIVLLLGVLIALVPRAESVESTLALRRFLAGSGYDVSEGGPPPEPSGTYVLLSDLRTPDEDRALLAWAASGGRLVVADPRSNLVRLAGATNDDAVGLVGARTLSPSCLAEEAVGVREIIVRASDRLLGGGDRFVSCYGGHMLVRAHDRGTVVLLGGLTALTNENLRSADNAVFALRLAGTRGQVVFGPPLPIQAEGASSGVWAAMPERAQVVIVSLVLAAVAFAALRARRLGRPPAEDPIAPIPGSELVRATSRLYRRGRSRAYAAALMRRATRARLGRRFGVPGDGDSFPTVVANATGLPSQRVEDGLAGPEPRTDEELIRLGSLLSEIESRSMSPPGAPLGATTGNDTGRPDTRGARL
jgi:Domain of unknown function (DUF4350)